MCKHQWIHVSSYNTYGGDTDNFGLPTPANTYYRFVCPNCGEVKDVPELNPTKGDE